MSFSDRLGITKIDTTLQTDGVSENLRNSLWNIINKAIFQREDFQWRAYSVRGWITDFSKLVWEYYFKRPIDEVVDDKYYNVVPAIKKYFFECQWHEVYNFLEFIIEESRLSQYIEAINKVLEREYAGFRVIDNKFVRVTDAEEVAAIESAIQSGPYNGAALHLKQALSLLSDRTNPDLRNSIKESISAIESAAKEITGNPKATLGQAVAVLEKSGKMHAALKSSLSSLYGYTSDEGGIRHAMLDEPNLSAADAKFFLIICSAFVNYLKSKI